MNNKKGGLNLSLENVIGLVIAAILIPAIIIFSGNVTNLIAAKTDQSTLNSFDALVKTINQFVEAKDVTAEGILAKEYDEVKIIPIEGNKVQVVVPLFIQSDFGIVGFDGETIQQNCGDSTLNKPTQCINLPCLCLAKRSRDKLIFKKTEYLRCQQLNNVEAIYAINSGETKYNAGKEHLSGQYLSIWSNCGSSPTFGVKNVKIIKLPNGDKFNLLFEIPAK